MPAPAPPPRLTLRSDDVQAAVPDAAATELLALAEADEDAALVAEALAPEVLDEALDEELAETPVDDDDDDAAHPAASTPAASSGTASSAFFTRASYRVGDYRSVTVVVTDL
jgi:hypothetical protein